MMNPEKILNYLAKTNKNRKNFMFGLIYNESKQNVQKIS